MKSLIVRILGAAIFGLFVFLAIREKGKPEVPTLASIDFVSGDSTGLPAPPPGRYKNGVALFIYLIAAAVLGGVVVLRWIIPAMGEFIANIFYSSNETLKATLAHKAMAMVDAGDYGKALVAFMAARKQIPRDRLAVMELVKLHHDHLEDFDASVRVLEEAAAEPDWSEDDRCSFLMRAAVLIDTERNDRVKTKALLTKIATTYPSSTHANAARQKLHEYEEQDFLAGHDPNPAA